MAQREGRHISQHYPIRPSSLWIRNPCKRKTTRRFYHSILSFRPCNHQIDRAQSSLQTITIRKSVELVCAAMHLVVSVLSSDHRRGKVRSFRPSILAEQGHSYIPEFSHGPYVNMLPSREKLRTGLHFTPLELEMFRGTNMYGAIMDRETEWRREWEACRAVVSNVDTRWGVLFTWELFLESATHLSSRAFPSSLLSRNPTLHSSPSTEPVLLPGVDALNHARAHPVSWVVTDAENISLVVHTSASAGEELFNNYGAKPNSEFILGYGFSLPNNPDDTIVLKIGDKKWEVGREAKGADQVWDAFLSFVSQNPEPDYEDYLEAAAALDDAVQQLMERLPADKGPSARLEMRPEVMAMLHDYVEGQRDILRSLVEFCETKKQLAVELAKAEGIDLVFDDDD